jgi:hypothetical protein
VLGEKLAEYQGKITGQRILPSDGPYPKVETTFEVSGPILGMESTMMGTYWSTVRPDGTLYGDCPAGVLMTRDGEMATWIGTGAGRFTGQGSAVSFRGSVYYHTASQKLARLNGIAAVYEWDVDQNGDAHGTLWEWK